MSCIFINRTIGMTSVSIGTNRTIGTNGPSVWRIVSVCVYWTCVVLERNRNKRDVPVPIVPKKDVIIFLPYLGLQSNQISKRLKSCVYEFYSCVNSKIIFQNTCRIKSFFPYKDRLNHSQRSKACCWDCPWIVMIFTSIKPSEGSITGRLNRSSP